MKVLVPYEKDNGAQARAHNVELRQRHVDDVKFVRRVIWTFLIGFVGIFVVGGFNVWYTQHVDNERVKAQQQSSEEGRKVFCTLVNSQIQVYREAPPTTATGKNAQASWEALGKIIKCEEIK
jgi:cell division protein FtsI/penicillin-binding protein 2